MSLLTKLMTKNVGHTDRLIRALPFAIFCLIWSTESLSGVPLLALGVFSVMALFTAITARCTIYAVTGLNTCEAPAK